MFLTFLKTNNEFEITKNFQKTANKMNGDCQPINSSPGPIPIMHPDRRKKLFENSII